MPKIVKTQDSVKIEKFDSIDNITDPIYYTQHVNIPGSNPFYDNTSNIIDEKNPDREDFTQLYKN